MDHQRFDDLVRLLDIGSGPGRRRVLRGILAGAATLGLTALTDAEETDARKRRRRWRKYRPQAGACNPPCGNCEVCDGGSCFWICP